jgi:hypothetical protein
MRLLQACRPCRPDPVCLAALAASLGDDGLHKPDWLRETFKDLREDWPRPPPKASAC